MKARITFVLILVTALVCGLGVGWRLPRNHDASKSISNHPPTRSDTRQTAVYTNNSTNVTPMSLEQQLDLALKEKSDNRREELFYQLCESVPSNEIPRLIRVLARRPERETKDLINNLLARWARVDPMSATAYMQLQPQSQERARNLQTVLSEWATDDPAAALNLASRLPVGREKQLGLETVLQTTAERDPQRALSLLESDAALSTDKRLRGAIFRSWAKRDPASAARGASNTGFYDPQTIGELAFQWAAKTPNDALEWAKTISSPQAQTLAFQGAVQAWATSAPREAAAFVAGQPQAKRKLSLLNTVAKQWAIVDPSAAFTWATNLPAGPGKGQALQAVIEQYAQADRGLAASYAIDLLPAKDRVESLRQLTGDWFGDDPKGCLSWAKGLSPVHQMEVTPQLIAPLLDTDPKQATDFVLSFSDAGVRNRLVSELAFRWCQEDLPNALAWLNSLPNDEVKEGALGRVSQLWAVTDPQSAVAFAQTLPTGANRDLFLSKIAGAWGATDPSDAAQWIETLPTGASRDAAISSLVSGWANGRSYSEAATYVANLPAGQLQTRLAMQIANSWSVSDPQGAAAWVSQFPSGETKDQVVLNVLGNWGARDPASAATWLDSLGQTPENYKEMLAEVWLSVDAENGKAWIQTSNLPDDVKQRLLNRRPTPK